MTISSRVSLIGESKTIKINSLATGLRAAGKDVISLAVGEPDFDTPDNVKAAAIQAIQDGHTKYTAVDGIPQLKRAIVDKLARENNLNYTEAEVIASCGAKQVIYNLCQCLLNPGDEAIIPVPYWVSYPDIVALAGGQSVLIPTTIRQQFKITPQQLTASITSKTRVLFINSPNNPSGTVYSSEELAALGEVLKEHPKIIVISDDIYEHLIFNDTPFANLANACPDLKNRVVVVNGVSKSYAMTGWRIGYAAGDSAIIAALKKIQSQSTSNPASISQHAAAEALKNSTQFVDELRETFARRSRVMQEALATIEGLRFYPGEGSFYIFADFSGILSRQKAIADDIELAQYLLEKALVALVPGSAFGVPQHLRLSFGCDIARIEEGIQRIKTALEAL